MNTNLQQFESSVPGMGSKSAPQVNGVPARLDQTTLKEIPAQAEEFVVLRPYALTWLRKLLVCLHGGSLIASNLSVPWKGGLFLAGFVLLGTYWTTTVSRLQIVTTYRLLFVPIFSRRYSLTGGSCFQSHWEEDSGLCEAMLLGAWGLVIAPIGDWMSMISGGPYRLWLKSNSGHRVLIWRGRTERFFSRNTQLLTKVTGLKMHRVMAG